MMTDALFDTLSRRAMLIHTLGGGAGALLLGVGCRRTGAIEHCYAPWSFEPDEARPERVAVMAAILAASPHNTQPWLFSVTPEAIDVFANLDHSLGAMDSLHRELFIGLGCAIENLVIAAAAVGRLSEVDLLPDPANETHVARVTLTPQPAVPSSLFDALPLRHTNRGPYREDPLPSAFRRGVLAMAEAPVSARWVASESERMEVGARTVAATQAIIDDAQMNTASHRWWRHSAKEIADHCTGTSLDAAGLTGVGRSLARTTAAPDAEKAGKYWLSATEGRQSTAAAWVVLATPALEDRVQQLQVGRVFQRMHLFCESEGYALQPLNQALERRDREQTTDQTPVFGPWLEQLAEGQQAQMLFRLGVAKRPALASPRLSVSEVVL